MQETRPRAKIERERVIDTCVNRFREIGFRAVDAFETNPRKPSAERRVWRISAPVERVGEISFGVGPSLLLQPLPAARNVRVGVVLAPLAYGEERRLAPSILGFSYLRADVRDPQARRNPDRVVLHLVLRRSLHQDEQMMLFRSCHEPMYGCAGRT